MFKLFRKPVKMTPNHAKSELTELNLSEIESQLLLRWALNKIKQSIIITGPEVTWNKVKNDIMLNQNSFLKIVANYKGERTKIISETSKKR